MKKLLCTPQFIINRQLILLLLIFLSINKADAQWVAQPSNVTAGYFVQFIDAVDGNVVWGIVSDPANQTNPVQEFTRTVDGGATWAGGPINNAVGLRPSSICAINADTAWVAMYSPTGGAGGVLRTDDGGASWNPQPTALFNATGNFPNWIYFWDANNGLCMGDPTNNYFEIYTTTDGGNNWVRTPDTAIAPELGGEFGITDVFTHQGDSTIFFGTNLGRVYKSTDRGLNWTASQTPFPDYIGAIAFRDSSNGLATSGGNIGSSDVVRTNDGGATWNLVGTNTANMTLKLGMCYVPGTDSTYIISTAAAGSVDGTTFSPNDGTSWALMANLIQTDIEFVNDSTGWTGSNELNAPMLKWSTPIHVALDDVLSQSIDMSNTGLFTLSPQASFRNNGVNAETFDVTMTINGGYTSTKTINNSIFNDINQITFDPWTPAAAGTYTVTIYTQLAADSYHLNDTLVKNVGVFELFENYGWTSKPDVATGTFGLAGAFILNGSTATSPGQLFAIGGADASGVEPYNNSFATGTNTWSNVAPMPSVKYEFSAQRVGNKIYCAGGYTGGFAPDPTLYIYDAINDTWTNGTDMPTPVGDYASGVYNDSLIYYIGGYDGGGDQNMVQIYNPLTDTWTSGTDKTGTATAGLRGAINGNKIVVAGGFSQILLSAVAEAYIGTINAANPTQITWTTLPDYPGGTVSRLAAGTPFLELKPLIVFAGGDPNGGGTIGKSDCWGYDLQAGAWKSGTPKTTGVSNISDLVGLVYNDSLWMASVAGYDGSVFTSVNEWLNIGASPPIDVGIHENASADASSVVYPNPVINSATILFSLSKTGKVTIKIFDPAGRLIATITDAEMQKGEHQLEWNVKNVDAGIYFMKIETENYSETKKISVVK
ncbi:MAG: T9SS type A sorting domain-containing protein [Bacteroidia bacterium]